MRSHQILCEVLLGWIFSITNGTGIALAKRPQSPDPHWNGMLAYSITINLLKVYRISAITVISVGDSERLRLSKTWMDDALHQTFDTVIQWFLLT